MPYLRTRQTAAATIARLPNVPVEVWLIQEFTYSSAADGMEPAAPKGCPQSEGIGPRPIHGIATGKEPKASRRCYNGQRGFGAIKNLAGGYLGLRLQPRAIHPSYPVHCDRLRTDRAGENAEVRGQGNPAIANAELVKLSSRTKFGGIIQQSGRD